jgi:exodeoxyribonuclease V alpha subunit
MSRGLLGTRNLNKVLQQLINPPSPEKIEITRGETIFRTGEPTGRRFAIALFN